MSKTIYHDGDEGVLLIIKDKKKDKPVVQNLARSPVHVVYGGAHLFKANTAQKLGKIALATMQQYTPNFVEFAQAMRMEGSDTLPNSSASVAALEKQLAKNEQAVKSENFTAWLAWTVYNRTIEKLTREPVEDLRIDFEDGYGFRKDKEENAHAESASDEMAKALESGTLPDSSGFRIKPLAAETYDRGIKTLERFLNNLLDKTGGKLPPNFVVTLPKVASRKEISALVKHLDKIEKRAGLPGRPIGIEIMIETPQAILDDRGRVPLRKLVEAADGRCTSAHFGAYDYTAALGISGTHQQIHHPACDFARQMMLTALSPLGIRLSDSVTTQMPVVIHKKEEDESHAAENRRSVYNGWHRHFHNVTRSMINGFYQSWDLHPNQLPARYAAVYTFFLTSVDVQAQRLTGFVEKATQANLTGNQFDDAASAQGVVNYFRRAINSGAVTQAETEALTGIPGADLMSMSFGEMMDVNEANAV